MCMCVCVYVCVHVVYITQAIASNAAAASLLHKPAQQVLHHRSLRATFRARRLTGACFRLVSAVAWFSLVSAVGSSLELAFALDASPAP
jgi:hypothetical protein